SIPIWRARVKYFFDCGLRIVSIRQLKFRCSIRNPKSAIRNSTEIGFSFGVPVETVRRQVLESLAQSRWPAYLQDIDARRRARPEVEHELVLAHIARSGLYLGDRFPASHRDRRARPDRPLVASRP